MSPVRRGTPHSGQVLSRKFQDPVYCQETQMGKKESGSGSRTPGGQGTRWRATPTQHKSRSLSRGRGPLQFDDDNRRPWFPPAKPVEKQRPQ
ncbi:hypothetical protein MTO96_038394 [Rhipicephalus appendiculatus]